MSKLPITTIDNDLDNRVMRLPPKIRQPLLGLLAVGQLDENTVSVLLDAADAAGDARHLLGFAVGLLFMQSKRIPVADAIRMAKRQGRRISLGWSPKRWKAEHDRLSRAETLIRLGAENVAYDVSAYAVHLPERFSGYLIRSSRRLGMEGLRQRHCVASYHDLVKHGSCAIACVFVDGQRWTVQLHRTDDPQRPLRISQIKTRHNGRPDKAARERIYSILGIPLPQSVPAGSGGEPDSRSHIRQMQQVLPVLRDAGIRSASVYFCGSGDSGSLDHVVYDPKDFDGAALTLELDQAKNRFNQEEGCWETTVEKATVSMNDAVESLVEDYLETTDVNWYNDSGGYGEFHLDVGTGTTSMEVNVNIEESQCEFDEELDIEPGEPI